MSRLQQHYAQLDSMDTKGRFAVIQSALIRWDWFRFQFRRAASWLGNGISTWQPIRSFRDWSRKRTRPCSSRCHDSTRSALSRLSADICLSRWIRCECQADLANGPIDTSLRAGGSTTGLSVTDA